MVTDSKAEPDTALAQMVHRTNLFTWLVRVAGKALAILILVPLACAFLAAIAGAAEVGFAAGTLVTVASLLWWLTGIQAPFPTDGVLRLMGNDAGTPTRES